MEMICRRHQIWTDYFEDNPLFLHCLLNCMMPDFCLLVCSEIAYICFLSNLSDKHTNPLHLKEAINKIQIILLH